MLATMADAHREWHSNAGVPMGTPGCPQDACHVDDHDDDLFAAAGERIARCGCGCQLRLPIDIIRAHFRGVAA